MRRNKLKTLVAIAITILIGTLLAGYWLYFRLTGIL